MTENDSKRKIVPLSEEDFAKHLRKYRIPKDLSNTIAENISRTGGSKVFEDPDRLGERLSA